MNMKNHAILGVFSALSIISIAQAHEVNDDSSEPDESGESDESSEWDEWGDWGESSTEDELDEHEEELMMFWSTVRAIQVGDMPFDPPEGEFDCDDFAWCFDDVCEELHIESWELWVGCRESFVVSEVPGLWGVWTENGYALYCLDEMTSGENIGCWYQLRTEVPVIPDDLVVARDKRNGSHVMNIIKVPSPPDSDVDQYCIVEPQTNGVVVCWTQDASDAEPIVPIEAKFTLQQFLVDNYGSPAGDLCQTTSIMTSTVFEGGHYTYAGEAPFTDHPDVVDLYEQVTGMCAPTF
jgi:hypothetical protein